jgi:hypothetical protein
MNLLRITVTALAAAALACSAFAAPRLFGVNPSNNGTETVPEGTGKALGPGDYGFYEFNPATGAVIASRNIAVPGRTITGALALARDPITGIAYAVVKANGVQGRLLITINLETAVGAEVGNLGDQFSSLAFRADGQLFGVTGDGAAVPETLYLINKANATKTLAATLGNGADGEVIAYNANDNSFYHFSGNGTVVFERVLATAPYTVTPIVPALATNGEVFGAVWDPSRNAFLVSDIGSRLTVVTTAGVVTSTIGTFPTNIRGLILQPDVIAAEPPRSVPTVGQAGLLGLLFVMGLFGFARLQKSRREE